MPNDIEETDGANALELTADIVAAYVSNNSIGMADLPSLIGQVHHALVGPEQKPAPRALVPAVPIKKSVTPDFIISLEDGQKFKSLRRHLRAKHGMTPDDYRKKWGLAADYPMVAPNYTAFRSALAKKVGLGRPVKDDAATKKKKRASRPPRS
jgi:predicted transcriptional regulator